MWLVTPVSDSRLDEFAKLQAVRYQVDGDLIMTICNANVGSNLFVQGLQARHLCKQMVESSAMPL